MRRTLLVLFILMMAVTSGAQPIRDTKILLPLVVEDPIYGAYAWSSCRQTSPCVTGHS